jgi:hypothetical protein
MMDRVIVWRAFDAHVCRVLRACASFIILVLVSTFSVRAQTTGTIVGRVLNVSGDSLAGADVRVMPNGARVLAGRGGRFVLTAVPVGEVTVRVDLLGYQPTLVSGVQVRSSRATEIRVELKPAPVQIQGITVEADRQRLIEPEVNASHEVLQGRELRELPIDRVDQAVELATGVSQGHFRGGRIGQEVILIDGLEVKNQLEASTQGTGLELSPSSLEEVEVVTGGFGAEYGSALSGVVSFVTRRGNTERWEGRAGVTSDQMMPASLFRGFTGVSLSGGGPLGFLGNGATLYADVLAQGLLDADPRSRGLTCLTAQDADATVGAQIALVSAASASLLCPYTSELLPHQQGDKLIGFTRFDRPITKNLNFTATLLHNRGQHELYTPQFKYNSMYQLGQTASGNLGTMTLDWSRNAGARAYHVTARTGVLQLDRYLGVVDPADLASRSTVAGFGLTRFKYLGEDFVRRPIAEQLAEAGAVPGYLTPGGTTGSPFGPAGEGIFFTKGTPDLANWSRSKSVTADVVGEGYTSEGSSLRGGGSLKLFQVESYERSRSYLAGSAPNYARFYPATASSFVETQLNAGGDVTLQIGIRVEAFRSGLDFRQNRSDFLSPVISTAWHLGVLPRLGASIGVPGTHGKTAMRFNYGSVAQPPDFRYFLDTTIGDSLRTDIRRQGNPNLAFEKGTSYEVGLSHLLLPELSVGFTAFRKDLKNLVASGVALSSTEASAFNTGDFGSVQGIELSARGRWRGVSLRGGYALQKAVGTTSSALGDPLQPTTDVRIEYPLAFDRRHSADFAIFAGRAAGLATSKWSASAVASAQSGYPLDLRIAGGGTGATIHPLYLPWSSNLDLKLTRDIVSLPGCVHCALRIVIDGRNVLGSRNIQALNRDSGMLAPTIAGLQAVINGVSVPAESIPYESPRYTRLIDLNGDGYITPAEFRTARIAAALDRFDPSLYFGEARQVRVGVEVAF